MTKAEKTRFGSIGWVDLSVQDAEAVKTFYEKTVGWSSAPVSMGDYADYNMLGSDGTPSAGICHAKGANQGIPPQWIVYITVLDLDESLKVCRELGGEVVHGPRGEAGHGRFCLIRDPAGAIVAFYEE